MNIRQQIQDKMTKVGYTKVTATPSSFYIRAKNKQGDPVAMVIGLDAFTEVTEMPMSKMKSGTTMAAPPAGTTAPTNKP